MAENEYIEREKRYIEISRLPNFEAVYGDGQKCLILPFEHLYDIPAADVVEVRHGEWKFHKDGSGTCNQCGGTQLNVWDYDSWQNFCGRCGAKMDGKGEGE